MFFILKFVFILTVNKRGDTAMATSASDSSLVTVNEEQDTVMPARTVDPLLDDDAISVVVIDKYSHPENNNRAVNYRKEGQRGC